MNSILKQVENLFPVEETWKKDNLFFCIGKGENINIVTECYIIGNKISYKKYRINNELLNAYIIDSEAKGFLCVVMQL